MAYDKTLARDWPLEISFRGLMIVLAGLLVFRIIALYFNQTDLFFDEAQYWLWGKEPDFGYFSKPPVLGWTIGAFTGLFGSDSPFIIRLASPVMHSITAIFIFLAGREIFDMRTGFWSAIIFATLPAVSLSSTLISTDVPLLMFWSVALYGFARLFEGLGAPSAWILGGALGLGLMSKYAMVFFVFCAGLYFIFENRGMGWRLLWSKAMIIIAGLAFLILLPNIHWNLNNGLATVSHTADNANWGKSMFHPQKMLEFLGAQFGVFGPILFGSLLAILWRHIRGERDDKVRMLLWFSIPIILVITTQAFLSRAHANWAATAYPAATILVTAVFLKQGPWRLFQGSLALHLGFMVLISFGAIFAPKLNLPIKADPFYRVLGWQGFADDVRERLRGGQFGAVLAHRRVVAAELIYYLRDLDIPVTMWKPKPVPHNHYEMTRPFGAKTRQPVLYVTDKKISQQVLDSFSDVTFLGRKSIAASPKKAREFTYYSLSGFKGK